VDPKRIEARLASQKYREAQKQEYNDSVSRNQMLKNENLQARQELLHRGDQISLAPPPVPAVAVAHLVIPTTWKRAETRKERNRQAAKRSRDAAKNTLKILNVENEHLLRDNLMLHDRLRSLQNNKRIAGVVAQGGGERKRRNTAPSRPSSFVLSEHALLLLSCLCLLLGCTFQANQESTMSGGQQSDAGMDLSAGLVRHTNLNDAAHPVPLLAAGVVCVCSVAVAAFSSKSWRSKSVKL
jgi:hypothetical protein